MFNCIEEIIKYFNVNRKALIVRSMLYYLIRTENDRHELINEVQIANCTLFHALMNIKKRRVDNALLSISEKRFSKMYSRDRKEALQQLFVEEITIEDLKNLEQNNILSCEIYNKHIKQPSWSFMKLIKASYVE